jgi:hypothetical protein
VNRGEAERVADEFLRQRHEKAHAVGEPDIVEADKQLEQEMADAFVGRAAGGVRQMLAENGGFAQRRPE